MTVRETVYEKFKAIHKNDSWCVVTEPHELIIARVPQWIKYPKSVATALAESLTKSKYALTDLI